MEGYKDSECKRGDHTGLKGFRNGYRKGERHKGKDWRVMVILFFLFVFVIFFSSSVKITVFTSFYM